MKNDNKHRIKNNETFVERLNEIKPDFEVLEKWNGSQNKIKFLHKNCENIFEATPNNMLKENYGGCPECAKHSRNNSAYLKKIKGNIQKVKDKLDEIYKNKEYSLLETKYKDNKEPMLVRCNRCKYEFKISYVNICKGKGCKFCNQINKYNSKGTLKIEEVLNNLGIYYDREVRFEECKIIKELSFDFIIYLNKEKSDYILLEYDGELHFRPFNNDSRNIKKFNEQVKRDNVKNKFCKDYNIEIIRINYNQYNQIETIIKNKIYKKILYELV